MPFSLEVLQAKHGDCLILHSGTKEKPHIMIIDGGPSGVYSDNLKPRLLEMKKKLGKDSLPISLVMISHIDDDHINGILRMTDDLLQDVGDKIDPLPLDIRNFWCNSFDDIIGNVQLPYTASASATAAVDAIASSVVPLIKKENPHMSAVITSVKQGRDVRKNVEELGIPLNRPFEKLKNSKTGVVRGDTDQKPVMFEDVKLTVLHPNEQRLQELQDEWDRRLKVLAKNDKAIETAEIAALMTDLDKSPYNLSSIVCLAEVGGKKILLTGDARMDDIEEGLKFHKLLGGDKDKFEVDIFKVPHHGSCRNATVELLKLVKAKAYVISADGSYDNPDLELLDMLADNIETGTVYLTYKTAKPPFDKNLKAFRKKLGGMNSKLELVFPDDDKTSVVIDLASDKLWY